MVCFGGISGEFCQAMVHILVRHELIIVDLISSEIDWSGCKVSLPLEVGFVYSCYLSHHAREKHADVTTQIRGAQKTI